jgi:cytochrome oxidase Cu insertion factor (SCO1/SenC/PrrC family)
MTGRQQRGVVETVTVILGLLAVLLTGARAVLAGPPPAEELKNLNLAAFSSPVKAPDFVLRNLQGKEVHLDIYRGKPLLLYFWATW